MILYFFNLIYFISTSKVPSKHCRFGNQPGQHELRYTHAERENIILFVFVVVVVVVAIPFHFIFPSFDHESCVNAKNILIFLFYKFSEARQGQGRELHFGGGGKKSKRHTLSSHGSVREPPSPTHTHTHTFN